jgi:23S rRNA pseudouridine2605 synthase
MDFAPFVEYRIIKSRPTYSTLKVTISEGKNRELRRFFGFFDAEVVDLKRVSYGRVDLGTLKPGKTRFFDASEYTALRDYLKYIEEKSSEQQ